MQSTGSCRSARSPPPQLTVPLRLWQLRLQFFFSCAKRRKTKKKLNFKKIFSKNKEDGFNIFEVVVIIFISVLFGISSDKFKISNTEKTIYVYSPVTVVEFLNGLDGNSGKVLKDGTQYNSGNVGTGMTIDDYVIVLRGDVTGDGLIKVNDVMKISKYTVEGTGLDDKFLKKAADVTNDSLIKVNDVMKISKYTVEGGTL